MAPATFAHGYISFNPTPTYSSRSTFLPPHYASAQQAQIASQGGGREGERRCAARKIQDERGRESLRRQGKILQTSGCYRGVLVQAREPEVDSASREPENYEVLVVEGEELEVDEPAFGKLVAGAVEQSGGMYL